MRATQTLLAAAVLASSLSAGAADLLDVWRGAREHDPEAAVAEAVRLSAGARREQARALWRPGVELSANAGRMSSSSAMNGAYFSAPGFGQSTGVAFATSVNQGDARGWALGLRQPLISGERRARSDQLEQAAGAAELEARVARQSLMLGTAQRYFEAVLASQRQQLLQAQLDAAERALTEARDRFRLGDAPVTDIHEAQARAQGLRAQRLEADNQLQLSLQALRDSSGLPTLGLPLAAPAAVPAPAVPGPLEAMREQALADSPGLGLLQARVALAEAELRGLGAASQASLDLVAQASEQRLSGSGSYGPASNDGRQQMIGLQLRVPIYTGGGREARQQEALHALERARAELDQARLQTGQQTRAAWLALDSAPARLAALQAAFDAANARLDATRLGRSVGDRTTLDLLNADNERTAAALALLQGRIDSLQQSLRLQALLGRLDEGTLAQVNAALTPSNDKP